MMLAPMVLPIVKSIALTQLVKAGNYIVNKAVNKVVTPRLNVS